MRLYQHFIIFLCSSFLLSSNCFSQVSYEHIDNYINESDLTFNTIISIDLNNDLIEDIIHFHNGNKVVVNLNNRLGRDWLRIEGPVVEGTVWGGVATDLNNDGFIEIVIGSVYANVKIYTFNHETLTFELYQELPTNIFVQNINTVDINKDGYADVFLCNDNGENHFYLSNNGVLEFLELIDFSTSPVEHSAGNYASQFIDFDLDGDEDLYITKCSASANGPEDPRRINQLFINDGNGNFTEDAEKFNINTGAQSWTSDFGDLDLDGDLDLIVANHYESLQLYENINNEEFVEVQNNSGLKLQDFFFQVALQDVNNDGYEDIIITENTVKVYINNGDFTFTLIDISNSTPTVCTSLSLGDYNNDGLVDMNLKEGSFSSNTGTRVVIQKNSNSNHWIKFAVEGTEDTYNALGTRIRLYTNDMTQNRIKRFGRSYGVQFANQLHFGIGENTIVDSIEVFWLNGTIEKFYNLEINKTHYIKQNTCKEITENYDISQNVFCEEMTGVFNHVSDNFNEWNTGETSPAINISEEGEYFSIYNPSTGCSLNSWKAYVEFVELEMIEEERKVVDSQGLLPCEGEEIILTVPDENAIWNGVVESNEFISTSNNPITLSYIDNCTDYDVEFTREDIDYEFNPPEGIYEYATGSDILIEVNNSYAEWYTDTDSDPFHVGEEFLFENITEDEDISILNRTEYKYNDNAGILEFDNSVVSPSNINIPTYFTVHETIKLNSISVKSVAEGTRTFEIFDLNSTLIFELTENIPEGEIEIDFDLVLEPGNYSIMMNQSQNVISFGTTGPLFHKEQDDTNTFPFIDDLNRLEITGNGTGIVYFFYNWKISGLETKVCEDQFYETKLKMISSLDQDKLFEVNYNSLVSSVLTVNVEGNHNFNLYDSRGVLIASKEFNTSIDYPMNDLASGIYYMLIDDQSYKIIKQ